MRQKLIWSLCLAIASSINYAFAFALRIIWDVDLYAFIFIVFIFGFVFGLVMANIERTIIFTGVSLILGAIIGSALIISPTMVYSESSTEVNLAILTTIHAVSVHLLFSSIAGFFGAILGVILGERFLETGQTPAKLIK